MKKSIRRAITLALAVTMILTSTAMADTIVSDGFKFPTVAYRPTEAPTEAPATEAPAEPTVAPPAETTDEPAEGEAAETPEAEPTAEVIQEPTSEPTAEPLPPPTVSISSNLAGRTIIPAGTEMVLTLHVEGAAGRSYTIQWQQSTDDGATWQNIDGANAETYALRLATHHTGMMWRVTIDLIDPAPAA